MPNRVTSPSTWPEDLRFEDDPRAARDRSGTMPAAGNRGVAKSRVVKGPEGNKWWKGQKAIKGSETLHFSAMRLSEAAD